MHDIVYILGNGSKWNDNELRYSLRSLEKHFKHGRVFIVGALPEWLQNVIHIDVQDSFEYSDGGKMRNAIKKIRAACKSEDISDSFVLMNDDFYFLKDCPEIMPYSLGTVQDMIDRHRTKKGYYFNALRGTMHFIQRQGIETPIGYGIHYPIVYEKEKFLQMTVGIDMRQIAYSWRTIYGNIFNIGNVKREDTKIHCFEDFEEFLKREETTDFLSSSDRVVLIPQFQEWIRKRFPEPSKYERNRTDRHALQRFPAL